MESHKAEMEINMEEIKTDEIITDEDTKKVNEESSVDLIELVRSKHEGYTTVNESFGDVLVMQISLCIILIIILIVINIISPNITKDFVGMFKKATGGETEKIFEKAVFTVMNFING